MGICLISDVLCVLCELCAKLLFPESKVFPALYPIGAAKATVMAHGREIP